MVETQHTSAPGRLRADLLRSLDAAPKHTPADAAFAALAARAAPAPAPHEMTDAQRAARAQIAAAKLELGLAA